MQAERATLDGRVVSASGSITSDDLGAGPVDAEPPDVSPASRSGTTRPPQTGTTFLRSSFVSETRFLLSVVRVGTRRSDPVPG